MDTTLNLSALTYPELRKLYSHTIKTEGYKTDWSRKVARATQLARTASVTPTQLELF